MTAPWVGLSVAVLLIAAAMIVPALTGLNVHESTFPPLHASWRPRIGPGTIPAIAVAVLGVIFAPRAAALWRWRGVLIGAYLLGLAWLVALAAVDGWRGIGHILDTPHEYLPTARSITDIVATLHGFVDHIPLQSHDNWQIQIAGHPPGALLFFVLLARLGLGSGLAAGIVVVLIAATVPIAVLITLRRLGGADAARRAAPLLVLSPMAIWMAVSGDAVFAAFAAWALCCLAVAATTRSRTAAAGWAVGAGLLFGCCTMLSYGLPLLGVLALTVLIAARSWWPLLWAVGGAVAVVLVFAAFGFAWWQGYPVLVQRYWAGDAHLRPGTYWTWADLAALCIGAGPILGAAVAAAIARIKGVFRREPAELAAVLLTIAALLCVVLADISQMSRAEVERIWLPFMPWLLVGTALLPPRWRRYGLVAQTGFALLAQHLLATGW
ncbi:glycosyltransferase family 39 protein [Leifsonia sp. Root112D2]|uniref:glycosyltransferase family 39 protein n=1 Tax=Leifsonia sp. Root112D2 TaxID=1736426 RepID=UPI0006F38C51|nr:glycosyltransferase family 39 protein [Leifsonia sp. Root112D2]KQV08504.1 hypothetical protein ASC63_10540 [Leifsonia sp. Root112D2]